MTDGEYGKSAAEAAYADASKQPPVELPRPGRTAHTPCDEPGCDRSPADGHALFRVNPKGQPGIFMCEQHEAATWGRR